MATINKRARTPQAFVINGIDAGGAMQARISCGYDTVLRSSPDGLSLPIRDRETQFVRGSIVSQDWVHAVELLTGTVSTLAFSDRDVSVAEATAFRDHVITAPVIHRIALSIRAGGYATVAYGFECRAADETKAIADMWAITTGQPAPTLITAARGGMRIEACTHGAGGTLKNIYHCTGLEFTLAMNLLKRCQDGDVGYTCVEAQADIMTASGRLTFEDASLTTSQTLAQRLVAAAMGNLVLTIRQGSSGADKTVTIANVEFDSLEQSSDAGGEPTGFAVPFEVNNVAGTPLTLAGANKIIVIA